MNETLTTLKKDFDKALVSRELETLDELVSKFDSVARQLVETANDEDKGEMISECIALHDLMEQQLIAAKDAINKEIVDARSNGKKINKYLNV